MTISTSPRSIEARYVLLTRIPLFKDNQGKLYTDRLWSIDLLEHLNYIPRLRLCCPVNDIADAPADIVLLEPFSLDRVTPLREDKGWLSVAANIVPNFVRVLQAVKKTDIAHGGLAGWAFPLDYYLLALKPFLSFQWITVMESSFWMKHTAVRNGLRQWLGHHLHLALVRRCLKAADIRIFTQDWYRDHMLGGDTRNTLINEASWVGEKDVLQFASLKAQQLLKSGPVKLLMPVRLIGDKGVQTLLDAVTEIEHNYLKKPGSWPIIIDIIGSGPMESEVRRFLKGHTGRAVQMSLLEPVEYGPAFFALLSRYDAIIVANLKEEQPRIIYDAFSQGIPCIASRTSGILQIVKEPENAMLFSPGSAGELAERLREASQAREKLAGMGEKALAFASDRTHQAMHRTRANFLLETLRLP